MRRLVQGLGVNDWLQGSRDSWTEYETRVYDCWRGMLRRKRDNQRYPTYVGVIICERWLQLSYFAEDIKKLPGYFCWKNKWIPKMDIDKDIRLGHAMIYDSDHCMCVSHGYNTSEVHKRRETSVKHGRPIVCTSPDGIITEYSSANEVERLVGVRQGMVREMCEKSYGSSQISKGRWRGWKFEYRK